MKTHTVFLLGLPSKHKIHIHLKTKTKKKSLEIVKHFKGIVFNMTCYL